MRLGLFGVTGNTGRLMVADALARGYDVMAFARRPDKLTVRHERLEIVAGEITDAGAVEAALSQVDAVASALGPHAFTPGTPIARGTQHIITAMQARGIRRLIITATPSDRDPQDAPDWRMRLLVGLVRLLLHPAYEDVVATAQVVRSSDRDWTIVRVPLLRNSAGPGKVHVGYVGRTMGMWLSRPSLARFLLDQVENLRYLRQAPAISDGESP